ncbi:MAG: hypothetical protein ACUVUD_06620 [bacterium]
MHFSPRHGDVNLVLEPILRTICAEAVATPTLTIETVTICSQLAPETICLPFKITLGDMLNAPGVRG